MSMPLSCQMNLLLKEYILSGEIKEAERCLRDLEVPHFHHEFVYEVNHQVKFEAGQTRQSVPFTASHSPTNAAVLEANNEIKKTN